MVETSNVPALYNADDGFDLVATPTEQSFRASNLRFIKGIYVKDAGNEPVPAGTQFIAIAASECWVRLKKGEAPQEITRQPSKPFPRREELPDQDPELWATFDGTPSDPWKLTNKLLLADTTSGTPAVFSTSSFTGKRAV
jgi:hypothetical protein